MTRKLPAKARTALDRELRDMYAQDEAYRACAAIINACASQGRGASILTGARLQTILDNDPNLIPEIKNLNRHYSFMLRLLHSTGSVTTFDRLGQLVVFNAERLAKIGVSALDAATQHANGLAGPAAPAHAHPATLNNLKLKLSRFPRVRVAIAVTFRKCIY